MTRYITTTDQSGPAQQENSSLLPHELPQFQNPYLNQLLPQLINRNQVVQLFYTPKTSHENARLIVHLELKNEADTLQNQKWVAKLHNQHNAFVHCFYSTQLHYLKKTGNPFILAHCKPSAIIYANNDHENHLLLNHADKKKHLKKYKTYKTRFYHDHELLRSQIKPLVTADCAAAVLFQYESLLAYDLEYLEALYMGAPSGLLPLHERIAALAPFVPEIQQYFVKGKGNGYYLTTLIEKAKEASQDMECYFASENYEAFRLAEAGLFNLIAQRLKVLKHKIKGKKMKPLSAGPVNGLDKHPALPERAMAVLQKISHLEEVYLFHHIVYGETQTYYLLLIGQRLGNTYLKDLTTQLKAASGAGREYVLIGHTRQWIQEWRYSYQSFFYKIINKENRVFASSPYHPVPHWEVPYTPEYPELEHYMEQTEEVFEQFLFMADCDKLNYQGVASLFALFFQCFCRTYLYATLSYNPNCISSATLWQLCLYTNPNLKHYEYLFTEVDNSFFDYLDHHRTIQTINSYLLAEKRKHMIKISEILMNELNQVMENHNP